MPGVTNAKGLTPLQEKFAHEYLVDLNPGAAAIRAGYSGSKKQNAARRGSEVLNNPKVQMRIQELIERRSQVTDVTAERVVLELARVGFFDYRELVSWGPGQTKWRASDEISDDTAAVVKEIYETEREMDDGTVYRTKRIQTHDKLAALKLLAPHVGVGQGKNDLTSAVKAEVEQQRAGEMQKMFEAIDNFRSEQEKALPEERIEDLG